MRKEIIILTISLGNDGAERVLSELANEWVKQGHKVTMIQTGAGNYGVSYKLSKDIEILNVHVDGTIKPVRYAKEIREIVKILKKRPEATVLSFIVASIFICGVASFFVKNRIVVSERNNPRQCPAGKLRQKLRDWAFCQAHACVFQTKDAMLMFPRRVQKKGFIIPNPINADLPGPYKGERRKVIVAASRLHPQKNLHMMIDAFYMFHKVHPDYKLEIYGQGSEREKLEEHIRQLELRDAVILPGFSNDIYEKMLDAAMYVSSSDYEGISNSMLEALGMGIPSVVTDCPVGGAGMMIKDGVNGILVPPGDIDGLYAGMIKVIESSDLAEKLSTESVKIRRTLSIEKIANKWLEVL